MFDAILILFLAFAPMLFYAWIFWWFDRYEKEPLSLLVAAFIWGAVPSIVLALIMQLLLDAPIVAISPNELTYNLLGASVAAPLTEEGVKAMALIILLVFLRREIDSPMDGLIYGGLVGLGFAAVENVFYFLGAYTSEGVTGVVLLAVLRAGIFGLNHAMYTAFTGLGVALSLEVRNKLLWPVLVFGGFTLAVIAHALHNAFATLTAEVGWVSFILAILADWGGIFILLVIAIVSYFLERKRIVDYSKALVEVHAIPNTEADILKSPFQRRLARLKVLFAGNVKLWKAMHNYHNKVTEAAFTWHRMNHGDAGAQKRLVLLEKSFLALRKELAPSSEIAVG